MSISIKNSYCPVTVTKEQLAEVAAAGDRFVEFVRKETEAVIQRRLDHLAYPMVLLEPLADPPAPAPKRGRPKLTREGQAKLDQLRAQYAPTPLDVEHDGVTLRELLRIDEGNARNDGPRIQCVPFSPAQRAAVSAHWSAELRAKVATSTERERNRVLADLQDEP